MQQRSINVRLASPSGGELFEAETPTLIESSTAGINRCRSNSLEFDCEWMAMALKNGALGVQDPRLPVDGGKPGSVLPLTLRLIGGSTVFVQSDDSILVGADLDNKSVTVRPAGGHFEALPGAISTLSLVPQNPAPSLTPQHAPLHCQPDIIKAMEKAWMRSGNGTRNTEAGFVPYRGSDGKIGTANLPNTNQDKRISFKFSEILPKGATPLAIFHTHPNASGEKPSTGDLPSDVDTATRTGLPLYVISNRGLNVYDPATRKTGEVRDNLDWLKSCK